MKRKDMKLFLVLGVVLLSLFASGCTPNPETKPSETEPERRTIAFSQIVDTADIESISAYASHWSYRLETREVDEIASYVALHLQDTIFTGDPEKVDFTVADVVNPMSIYVNLTLSDDKSLTLQVNTKGQTVLHWEEQTLYLVSPEKLDYAAVSHLKGVNKP